MSEKKSFSEDAKGFLNMWKNDYAEKNKEILERKKQRDAETEALNAEIRKQFDEIKLDLSGKVKDIYDVLEREFKGFTQALKEGTATVAQKLELEKRLEQLGTFIQVTGDKSAEKLKALMSDIKAEINKSENVLESEVEAEYKEKTSVSFESEGNFSEDEIGKHSGNAKKLFDDIK